jgi:hypothetical protein
LLVWLFARIGVRGRDDKFEDLKGIRDLSTGGGDAKIVAFGEFDLEGIISLVT